MKWVEEASLNVLYAKISKRGAVFHPSYDD